MIIGRVVVCIALVRAALAALSRGIGSTIRGVVVPAISCISSHISPRSGLNRLLLHMK